MNTLMQALDEVPDPRSRHGRRHPIGAILALSVCAMLCGARSLYAISQWGRDQGPEMARALGFTRDLTPSVATLHRVFSGMDADRFEAILRDWMASRGLGDAEAIAVDGKSLRGIHGDKLPGVHLVAAFSHESGLVVGEKAVGDKGGELAALRDLLEETDIEGRVMTGDAQFAQRSVCESVVSKGATTS